MKYFIGEIKHLINKTFFGSNNKLENELRNNGIAVVESFITIKECEEIIQKIDDYISVEQKLWVDKESSDFRIYGFEKFYQRSKHLFSNIDSLYKTFISNNKCESFLMANKVIFKDQNKGSGGGWHRDSLNRRQLKFMIYLNDVDNNNGPFEYLLGSQKITSKIKSNHFLFKKTRYTDDEIDVFKSSYMPKKILGSSGTCVIFDSSGLHRGNPLLANKRYAITKYMFESKIPRHVQKLII